ncbi:AraC family transcriptional regulator [Novisyntrophococcus fermenticellae]|uniref:AraC family transcriptional regulator n=1 Tax=Novisyntrophococcus fermenticellae TaxID=2068655 RepID=UPI001E44671D|nr:AraC family transcriptional regulator [Novisyntrophococcus fermenticellae]
MVKTCIQDIDCSGQHYRKICSIDTEIIENPTTPLIHRMSRFWLINKGTGVLKLQDREYNLCPGTIVSILPWQISDIVQVDSPLQFFLLVYYFDTVNVLIKSSCNGDTGSLTPIEFMDSCPVVHCGQEDYLQIREIFEQLLREINMMPMMSSTMEPLYHSLFLKNKLVELIVRFQRIGVQNHNYCPIRSDIQKSDILHYMYNHLSRKLTLEELSRIFYMSESSISLYITQTTGLSFFNLLHEMRIGKTIDFLLHTNFTMEELAEILGFADSSHFCKVFAARTGMKANDFRKTYQNIQELCNIEITRDAYGVVSYIYRNYNRKLTPKETAGRFHITIRELNILLLHLVEKNFSDFLNFIRVNRASELLKNTEKGITEIAIDVGYNNAKTLTRNFLRFRTITPGAFRQHVELQEDSLQT